MAIFLVAYHGRDQILVASDLPVLEVFAQRYESTTNPVLIATIGDEVTLCFFQNGGSPAHGTEIALSESDRTVEQRDSVDDVRVEYDREPRN